MRQIVVQAWCDVCAADDVNTAADEAFTVGIVAGESRPGLKVLDLCAEHVKAFITPLTDLLANVGQTPELPAARAPRATVAAAGPPSEQPVTCRICGKTYTRAGSLTNHIYMNHLGMDRRPPADVTCVVCGFVAASPFGARSHASAAHGVSAADAAYEVARAQGFAVR